MALEIEPNPSVLAGLPACPSLRVLGARRAGPRRPVIKAEAPHEKEHQKTRTSRAQTVGPVFMRQAG